MKQKQSFLLLILLCISLAVLSQSTYQQQFNFSLDNMIIDKRSNNLIVLTKDNHVVLTAIKSYTDNSTSASGIFVKTDMAGVIKQQKVFRNPDDFQPTDIIEATDSGFVICGHTHLLNSISSAAVIKTDKDGNVLWSNKITDTGEGHAFKAIEVNDSTYFVVSNDSTGAGSIHVSKFSKGGQVIFETLIGWPGTIEEARSIFYSNGSVYVFGTFMDYENLNLGVVMAKMKLDGQLVWTKWLHAVGDYVVKRSDNSFALGGYSCSDTTCNNAGFSLAEIDTNGVFLNGKVFATNWNEDMTSLNINNANGYLISGVLNDVSQMGPLVTLQVDSSLNVISKRTMDISSTSMFPPQGPSLVRQGNNVYLGGIVYSTSGLGMPVLYKLDTLISTSCSSNTLVVNDFPITLTSPTVMPLPEMTCNTAAPLSVYTSTANLTHGLSCLIATESSQFNQEKNKLITVYPNPVAGNIVHVKSDFIIQEIRLFNSVGMMVYWRKCSDTSLVLSFLSLPSGLYHLVAVTNNGSVIEKVLVIKD